MDVPQTWINVVFADSWWDLQQPDTGTFSVHLQNCEKQLLAWSYLSSRMEQLGSHGTDFHEIGYLKIFQETVMKI
jgi:hypothetical protein